VCVCALLEIAMKVRWDDSGDVSSYIKAATLSSVTSGKNMAACVHVVH
jgi:hypothetical protein